LNSPAFHLKHERLFHQLPQCLFREAPLTRDSILQVAHAMGSVLLGYHDDDANDYFQWDYEWAILNSEAVGKK
jgi:hypothetical protein